MVIVVLLEKNLNLIDEDIDNNIINVCWCVIYVCMCKVIYRVVELI